MNIKLLNMKLVIPFLALFLSSCCEPVQRCGRIVEKWRQGEQNQHGVVVIDVNGTMHKGHLNDIAYAQATVGGHMCINTCK